MQKKDLIILGLIILFAGFIYFYKLGTIPNGFYVDEAVVAYNAKSIVETGRDIFAQPFPVLFRLLGSYTPSLFIYISAIFIKLFGNEITVFRSISVISALVSILVFFQLVNRLKVFKTTSAVLITTLFYAISPWMVFNARLGYETTLAYLLFNIGLYFLFTCLKDIKDFKYAIIFMSLSTYTAHTQRFLAPILLIIFFAVFGKEIFKKKNIKPLILSAIIGIIIHLPHLSVIDTPAFWVKNDRLFDQPSQRIIGNIFNQFFSYLSVKNIFYTLSDIDAQHTIPEISVMYIWMSVPYLIGLYQLVKRRKERNLKFVAILFFACLIPASLSGEFISIQRALPFLLPLMIVIGLGIDRVLYYLKLKYSIILFSFLFLYSLLFLYRSYFVLFPIERASAWNWGYDKLAQYIKDNPQNRYQIDNSRNPRNYILLLYFLDYPPSKYQNEVDDKYKTNYYRSLPPENKYKFSNIEVKEIDWEKDFCVKKVFIGDSLSLSEDQAKDHNLSKLFQIDFFEGTPVFVGYSLDLPKECNNLDF